MTKDNFTTIKVSFETKSELDKIKGSKESYNNLFNRLMKENEKLNKILSNVENLQLHLQQKEII
jgi:predicted CopG family antitoxin